MTKQNTYAFHPQDNQKQPPATMNAKETYYRALQARAGAVNEIELGKALGLGEEETEKIIAQLLAEHRIEYTEYSDFNYRAMKRTRKVKTSHTHKK